MLEVNYIKHLNTFFQNLSQDKRFNATHVSMYVVLFYQWNNARFSDEFYINRNEIMSLSRIGSKGTYHKCLKDLHEWQYLEYLPSYNPQIGSSIKMFDLGTSREQVRTKSGTGSEQVVGQVHTKNGTACVQVSGPYINNNKHNKQTNFYKLCQAEKKNEILSFFKKENWPQIEAEKFFNHYQGIGWKIGGKIKIVDWQATAQNWMLKFKEISSSRAESRDKKNTFSPPVQNRDNLHTNRNKNYNQPL
ncbi:MAG TPA: hypothetical protein DER05_00880 [Lutibacter sp.]|nr:hypothetical protein [Lutibacter sp.]